ncbi:MAG: histidine phosphatase family protein [Micropepsaceae bacterium]
MRVLYLTHPQVAIDPAVPVPRWPLSAVGRARAEVAARAGWVANVRRIVSSGETKAIETAAIIGAVLGVTPEARADMGENDRSATGFLAPDAFEITADRFFAHPDESIAGWETAGAAQARIVSAAQAVLAERAAGGDLLFVGHGAVGTLLMTAWLGLPISRALDQPQGGGNVFAFDSASSHVLHRWLPLEHDAVGMLGCEISSGGIGPAVSGDE